jgi:hypothetical protein
MDNNKIYLSFVYEDESGNRITTDFDVQSQYGADNELESICNAFAGFLNSLGFSYVQSVKPVIRC